MSSEVKVVISQSMYFPWVGLLEQIRLADIFVHYDDVQYTRGFFNRVQIKTAHGIKWLTVPIQKYRRGTNINDIQIDNRQNWREQHFGILKQAYSKSPYCREMLALVDSVFSLPINTLSDLSRTSTLKLAEFYGLTKNCRFIESDTLGVLGNNSQRLYSIVKHIGGNIYITGHGAANYLDHILFEKSGLTVQYMKYQCNQYSQLHGDFTPYVSGLDLIANCGKDGVQVIQSTPINWRDFSNEPYKPI